VSATAELWERLVRPFNSAGALEALTGITPASAHHLVDLAFATSREVDALLDRMHETLRSLAIATASTPTRSVGEIRGPILWSETIAARSASPGAHDVYICVSPVKAYDTDENRVLVNALARIRDAARAADPTVHHDDAEEVLRRARHNGTRAIRALEHRTLASVTKGKTSGRSMQKARSGSKARSYRTAVAVLDRCAAPLSIDDVRARCDDHTVRQHRLVLDLLDRMGTHGHPDAQQLRVHDGTLRAGPLRYLHHHRADADGVFGVLLGDLLLDAADPTEGHDAVQAEIELVQRAHGHPALVVQHANDIERAFRLAGI
jgi:hypothetical protein